MSNEEVVLQMVVNRLGLLLEAHEELRAKWSAEITEIILLGKGVLSPPSKTQTADGKWLLKLDDEEVERLCDVLTRNSYVEDYRQSMWNSLVEQLALMVPQTEEPGEEGPEDEGDDWDDDNIAVGLNELPEITPETPNEQA